jgi:parallel beta-helix repeat protein
VTNVRVTGGQLRGGGTGIRFERTVAGSTPYRFRVDQMLLTAQASYGMDVQSSDLALYPIAGVIEHNVVTAAGSTGIILTRSALGRVVDNAVDAGQNGIFLVSCKNLLLRGNTCANASGAGIELLASDGCSVVENNTSENNWGIYLDGSNHNRVASNTAAFNSAAGIYATGVGNHVQDNAVNRNSGVGIRLDAFDEGSVERNAAGNNTSYGIHATDSDLNAIDWNVVSGSGTGCPILLADSSDNTLTYNRTARASGAVCAGTNGIAQSGTSSGNTLSANLP